MGHKVHENGQYVSCTRKSAQTKRLHREGEAAMIDMVIYAESAYLMYSAKLVLRMSPVRRKVSCIAKAAARLCWV